MRISKIAMNGFGKFNTVSYDLDAPITLFYGQNEAGKSTVMGFIRTILFGFRTRTYMKDRYEPLRGGLHGGLIIMTDDEGHNYRIERYDHAVATKSALPQLRVTLDDGTVEGEAYLHKLLGEISGDVFQNLFAFSLSELQEMSALQSDEISGYLFNAGTGAGAKTILDAEKKIRQEMDQLFRPRGQTQLINKQVGDLREAQEKLNSSKASLARYNERADQLRQCDERIAQLGLALENEKAQFTWFEQCLRAHEEWTMLRSLRNELAGLEDDGVRSELAGQDRLEGIAGLGGQHTAVDESAAARSSNGQPDASQRGDRALISASPTDDRRRSNKSDKSKIAWLMIGLNVILPAILIAVGQWPAGVVSFVMFTVINGSWLWLEQREKRRRREEDRLAEEKLKQQNMAYDVRKNELQDQIKHSEIFLSALVGDDRRQALDKQLEVLEYNALRSEHARLNERIAELNDQLNEQRMHKGRLQSDIEQMVSDQTYSEQLQEFEELTASFQQSVDQWASRAFCLQLFKRAKEIYEREKQPGVLLKASEYFAMMTDRQFLRVMAPIGERSIRVERADGEIVDASFLSRGTAEQLYLAMRFALADQYAKKVALPIVMDDILVNFDPERLHNTMILLAQISQRHQLILFTCHPHIKEKLEDTVPHLQCVTLD